jgi:hypothetical protein
VEEVSNLSVQVALVAPPALVLGAKLRSETEVPDDPEA